jgi:hypothetical protein
MKRLIAALGILALSSGLQAASSLSPQPRVLILWENMAVRDTVTQALDALVPPQPYDLVQILPIDPGGIATALARGLDGGSGAAVSLDSYCQVWDMRFANNNGGPGTVAFDTVTLGGGSSDQALYEGLLKRGGSLFMVAENQEFHSRNDNLTQLLSSWSTAGPVLYPDFDIPTSQWTVFPPGSGNFGSFPNALSAINVLVPGFLPLNSIGSARPMATGVVNGVNVAGDIGFTCSDMNLGSGRVFVGYDFNGGFQFNPATNRPYVQNIYGWLGSCGEQRQVTKTNDKGFGATVNLGATYHYNICVNNLGALATDGKVWDTLPGCLSFQGSTPPPLSQSGNFLIWDLGSLAAGAQKCLVMTVRVASVPPCP